MVLDCRGQFKEELLESWKIVCVALMGEMKDAPGLSEERKEVLEKWYGIFVELWESTNQADMRVRCEESGA